MKNRLLLLLKTYLVFVLLFVVQKPLFMFYYKDLFASCNVTDYFSVMWHGLPLDLSISGYFTLLVGVLLIASLWFSNKRLKLILKTYYGVVALVMGLVLVGDMILYKYWGFRLDSTPLFYLNTPKDAFASASVSTIIYGLLALILVVSFFVFVFYHYLIGIDKKKEMLAKQCSTSLILLILTAFLIIPIRGGFTVSTMNVGWVYYSDNMLLNHAAINPCFSLLESLSREQSFQDQYRFLDEKVATKEFAKLVEKQSADSIPNMFTQQRPNVVLVILESFMTKVIEPLGGKPDVAPNFNKLCNEGVLFTNFYANSFRTDRGLVSILSGYPAQPTTSIMKYPQRSQTLPSISKSLQKEGYSTTYYYGGDANFTNMRSYLMSQKYTQVISDKDFPSEQKQTKWGAPDHYLFNRVYDDIKRGQKQPFFTTIQTLSSHEPFEVPSHRFKDPYLNSVFYTDSCLGHFIDQYKQTKYWKNTIFVLVPDHAMRYPNTLSNHQLERFQIPLLLVGGALKQPMRIDTYASQIDIAATLLYQLGISHKDFKFSKNILNPKSPHFGYFTFPDGFGMATSDNQLIFDCEVNGIVLDLGKKKGENQKPAKAYLQSLYNDLSQR